MDTTTRTFVAVAWLLAAAGLAVAVGVRERHPNASAAPLEPYFVPGASAVLGAGFEGGDFTLVDHRGGRISTAQDDGKLFLMTFGAAGSDLTDLALGLMARTLACLGPDAEQIRPILIALESAHGLDPPTADDMAAFDSRIAALSGDAEEIRTLARRYRVRHELDVSGSEVSIDHSAFLYLVGSEGRVRSYFPPSAPAAHLCRELRVHLGR